MNTQILLKQHAFGEVHDGNFEIVQTPIPEPLAGQVLRRTIYLSLDPYMRSRMATSRSYTAGVELGQVMVGGTISQVVKSDDPNFAQGDIVLGYDGWQAYAAGEGKGLRKLDPRGPKISYYLGVLGMPGMTAYTALLDVGRPQPGNTVVVSAAAGAVGSVAGQIAKLKGCRVIGSAGGEAKCEYVTKELGFDACINYKQAPLVRSLKRLCPDGIDVYIDNVAGPLLEAVTMNLAEHARIVLVGLISQYNDTSLPPGPNLAPLLVKRATLTGFLVRDWEHRRADFLRDMTQWVAGGQVKFRETIVEGLANAPRAFMGLFRGENVGKLIVQVGAADL